MVPAPEWLFLQDLQVPFSEKIAFGDHSLGTEGGECVCIHVTVLSLILGFFCVVCVCMFTITLRANTYLSKPSVMFLEVLLTSYYKDIFLYLC